MCIQDSLVQTSEFKISKDKVYIYGLYSGWKISEPTTKDTFEKLINNTIYEEYYSSIRNTDFLLSLHTSFIMSNEKLKNILDNLINLPTDKSGSCATERFLGIILQYNKYETEFMNPFFYKFHGNRV